MPREETYVVSVMPSQAMVYTQALESRIRSGYAEAPARTAKNKISKALRTKNYAILLTGPELEQLVDALAPLFEGLSEKYTAGITLEGEGRPIPTTRATPYPSELTGNPGPKMVSEPSVTMRID